MESFWRALAEPRLLGVLVYVVLQLVLGVAVSRRIRSESDFILAGRRLGYGLTTFSIFATWFGAETCVGSAGEVYAHGLSRISFDPAGYGLCLLILGVVFAAPLWRANLTTFADLFGRRFSGGVERLAALLLIPTSVLWAAAQVRAFGHVLAECSSALDERWGISLAALVVLIYTVSGGMLADAVTDLVQGVALIAGLLVVCVAVVVAMGGLGPALDTIAPEQLALRAPDQNVWAWLNSWANPIFGSILATELVSRVLAARSPQVARRSSFAACGLYVITGSIPVLLGLIGPHVLPGVEHEEQFLSALAQKHLHGVLYVLFAGALVSAILSTVDSCLLVAGSIASHNLLVPFFPGMSERSKLRAARGGVIVFGLLAYAQALRAESGQELLEEANGFGSAGIVVAAIFGLFTGFGGRWSAFAALIAGAGIWTLARHVWVDSDFAQDAPYLCALGAAFGAYVLTAFIERAAGRIPAGLTDRSQLAR